MVSNLKENPGVLLGGAVADVGRHGGEVLAENVANQELPAAVALADPCGGERRVLVCAYLSHFSTKTHSYRSSFSPVRDWPESDPYRIRLDYEKG